MEFVFLVALAAALVVGAFSVTRRVAERLGRRSQHTMRTIEHLVETERIPCSWIGDESTTSESANRREVTKRLDGYIRVARRRKLFSSEQDRANVVESLERLKRRTEQHPLSDIKGSDPRPRRFLVLFDYEGTLVEESHRVGEGRASRHGASLVPGARRTVRRLAKCDFNLGLVAEGDRETIEAVLRRKRLWESFEVVSVVSGEEARKPDEAVFIAALEPLAVAPQEYDSVIMVGDELNRDIVGANRLGLISVWLDRSRGEGPVPVTDEQRPHFTIYTPGELLYVVERLESGQL